MATRVPTIEALGGGAVKIKWTGLLNTDDGAPVSLPQAPGKSVHMFGTFGVGGSIQLEGKNDPAGGFVLATDPQGTTIVKTAEAVEEVQENLGSLRPRVTAGDGTTNLTCAITAKLTS